MKEQTIETISLICGLIVGALLTLAACMIHRHYEKSDACENAGGVLIEEKCLDIKQIQIIGK